jgi:hypothetical protein
MTLHRFAARRDDNEPEIRKRFAHHGWHTEQLSGKGMPDLLAMIARSAATAGKRCKPEYALVDVKEPTGKPTAAQVLKWQSLKDKGIPVYVARTPEDVDAIVAGTAEPWGLMEAKPRKKRGAHAKAHAERQCTCYPRPSYTPPRTLPDVAREAETFAPLQCDCVGGGHLVECVQLQAKP